jgi:hypothetical protein
MLLALLPQFKVEAGFAGEPPSSFKVTLPPSQWRRFSDRAPPLPAAPLGSPTTGLGEHAASPTSRSRAGRQVRLCFHMALLVRIAGDDSAAAVRQRARDVAAGGGLTAATVGETDLRGGAAWAGHLVATTVVDGPAGSLQAGAGLGNAGRAQVRGADFVGLAGAAGELVAAAVVQGAAVLAREAQVLGVQVVHRLEVQISLVWQVPQVSLLPQPSSRVPQFLPAEAQVLGVQEVQTLEVQISLVWQVPQVSLLPQPSSRVPQFLPAEAQVLGVQEVQTLEVQISLVWQVPQLSLLPQPSSRVPQFLPAEAQVLGVQLVQTLEVQISLVWQVPQLSLLPQPSSRVPQFLPAEAQVLGVQVTHLLPVQTLPPCTRHSRA